MRNSGDPMVAKKTRGAKPRGKDRRGKDGPAERQGEQMPGSQNRLEPDRAAKPRAAAQKSQKDPKSQKSKAGSDIKFRRRAGARPDEVLDAALELFIEKGFALTRVEDIAEKAGISKGSIYQYFPSKQALIEGLVKRAISPMAANAIAMITGFEGDPRTLITLVLYMIAARFEDGQLLAIPKLIMREAVSFPEIALMYRDQVLNNILPVFENMIKKGVEAGYFRKVDPELTIRSIMGPVITHLLLAEIFSIEPRDGLALERLIKNHLTILFDGLSLSEGGRHE